jgi:hypothetical protein
MTVRDAIEQRKWIMSHDLYVLVIEDGSIYDKYYFYDNNGAFEHERDDSSNMAFNRHIEVKDPDFKRVIISVFERMIVRKK